MESNGSTCEGCGKVFDLNAGFGLAADSGGAVACAACIRKVVKTGKHFYGRKWGKGWDGAVPQTGERSYRYHGPMD